MFEVGVKLFSLLEYQSQSILGSFLKMLQAHQDFVGQSVVPKLLPPKWWISVPLVEDQVPHHPCDKKQLWPRLELDLI